MSFLSIFQDFSLIIFRSVFTLPWCVTNEFLLYHGPQPKKVKKIACKIPPLQIIKKSWFWKIIFLRTHTSDMKRASHSDQKIEAGMPTCKVLSEFDKILGEKLNMSFILKKYVYANIMVTSKKEAKLQPYQKPNNFF